MDQSSNDNDLLEAWRQGSRDAGNALLGRHYPGVLRFFEARVPMAAGDLAQRTFLACAEARDRFEGRSSYRTFVFGIARRQLLLHLRQQHRRPADDFDDGSFASSLPRLTTLFSRRKEHQWLLCGLEALPIELQMAVGLFYWEGMGAAELGEVFDVPASTMRSRLARARQLLRQQIETLARSGSARDALLGDLDGWARSVANHQAPPRVPATLVGG